MSLVAQKVQFAYADPVLRGIDVRCEPGRVTTILGPNGCGKTTLLRLMLGLLKPQAGRCLLGDQDITALNPAQRASRLAYVPHRPEVGYDYPVRTFISFAHARSGPRVDLVDLAIDRMRLTELALRPMSTLSAGQAQRASFARALAQLSTSSVETRFLVADEPTAALDPRHVVEVTQTLRSLADEGVGVIVVLHDLSIASVLSDAVCLLDSTGVVHAFGSADEVLTPVHLSAVFGTSFGLIEHDGRTIPLASCEPDLIKR